MAGLVVSCFAMAGAIALLPLSGQAEMMRALLGLSGLLLGNAIGLVAASRFAAPRAAILGVIAIPFMALGGFSEIVMLAVLGLVALDLAAGSERLRARRFVVLAAGAAILIAGLLASGIETGAALCLAAGFTPVAVQGLFRTDAAADPIAEGEQAMHRLGAIIGAMSEGARRLPLVTDTVGRIEGGPQTRFESHLLDDLFPEGSLVEAVLIADRVSLLKALSGAVHEGRGCENLALRLRHGRAGAGYPMPPRYEAAKASIYPLPGSEGRAIVIIDLAPATASEAASAPMTGDVADAAMPAELLDRALHDCAAPFNAGLGYLEMIADPRLAPHDIVTFREFAAEAYKAMMEAHRNSTLLAHWVRAREIGEAPAGAVVEIAPKRLVQDALRALNLRDAAESGRLRVDIAENLPVLASRNIRALRLAVEVLLRFGHLAEAAELAVCREGDELVLRCRQVSMQGENPGGDSVQRALEAAVPARIGRFVPGDESLRELRIAAFAAAGSVPAMKAGSAAGEDADMRLAS